MCGRLTLAHSREEISRYFEYVPIDPNAEEMPARYNIAPTQPLATIRMKQDQRVLKLVRWGLVPGWVKDPKDFTLLINGRIETALDKPSFRGAMRHRRCLVPATGYYEWRRTPDHKQAFYMKPKGGQLIALAGLWDEWSGPDGNLIDSGALLTQPANRELSKVHHRMPVVLEPDFFDAWLDVKNIDARDAHSLLKPMPDDFFDAIPVSSMVNSVRNDGPDLIASAAEIEAPTSKPRSKPKPNTQQMDLF
ncbi:MAG: SOS response-associated peptidase [Hyphomicrobiales bacterium]